MLKNYIPMPIINPSSSIDTKGYYFTVQRLWWLLMKASCNEVTNERNFSRQQANRLSCKNEKAFENEKHWVLGFEECRGRGGGGGRRKEFHGEWSEGLKWHLSSEIRALLKILKWLKLRELAHQNRQWTFLNSPRPPFSGRSAFRSDVWHRGCATIYNLITCLFNSAWFFFNTTTCLLYCKWH